MSAIRSLLRVMTLRDAEAILLEAGKVPSLRRRGQLEALAMPSLEPALLAEFAAPLLAGREDWPVSVAFHDPDGGSYLCTIDKVVSGIRIVARPGKAVPAGPVARTASPALVARPASGSVAAITEPVPHGLADRTSAPVVEGHGDPTRGITRGAQPVGDRDDGRAQLAHILAGAVALARERGASDVILSTGQHPRLRIDGQLEELELAIADAELAACIEALGTNTDHSLELSGTRLRVNAFDHLNGYAVAARLIRDRVPSLAELSLPPEIGSVVDHRDGLVLVCGPTGSGKSTTLAALIDLLDQRRAAHVITLEDPIEYRFTPRRCVIHQRELGIHIPSFATGLRAALREAPDVILLGELRDKETIAAALTAAETGHLVLATMHASSAAGAIDRVLDAVGEGQQRQIRWQLAGVLRTVITQFLLPRRDGGRAPAYEIVPVTTAVANIIRKGDLHTLPTAIQSGRDVGMVPLERSLARLLDAGTVTPQAVKKIAADHDLLAALSGKLR